MLKAQWMKQAPHASRRSAAGASGAGRTSTAGATWTLNGCAPGAPEPGWPPVNASQGTCWRCE